MIESLYKQFHQELISWCRKKTQNTALSDDLVQETYLRALKSNDLFKTLEPRQQRAWLYRTLQNLYIDYIRRSAFEACTDAPPETQEEDTAYSEIDCLEMLNLLPDEEKVLFILRYLEGYHSTEIAKMFDLPPGTVRSRLSSARKRLRKIWS